MAEGTTSFPTACLALPFVAALEALGMGFVLIFFGGGSTFG